MIHIEDAKLLWSMSRKAIEEYAAKQGIPAMKIHQGCFDPPNGGLYYFIILRKKKRPVEGRR